jgi:riboflavin biosynthesis pyrimidine reductase
MMDVRVIEPAARPYLDIPFPPPPADRPYVVFNMVGSLDGKAVIEDTEQGLGSQADKSRMQELRARADAVMNGANTLRKSGASSRVRDAELVEFRRSHGKREQPLGVLLTTTGDFPFTGPYFKPPPDGLEAVVLASAASPERKAAIEARGPHVHSITGGDEGLRGGLALLRRDYGVELLLCEGGPTTLRSLADAGLADELFLTLSPALVGGTGTLTIFAGAQPYPPDAVRRLVLLSALANPETQEVYLRYRFRTGG